MCFKERERGEAVLVRVFSMQVEGAAEECSCGLESTHPDGQQMLENISEMFT